MSFSPISATQQPCSYFKPPCVVTAQWTVDSTKHNFEVDTDSKIEDLISKVIIFKNFGNRFAIVKPFYQVLGYNETKTLKDYGVKPGDIIMMAVLYR